MNDLYTLENWRTLAGTRQGLINKLDKKVRRLEAENATLKASLSSSSARLALYDKREVAA